MEEKRGQMKKGDVRRDEILATAWRLFSERGYEKTSVQDILDEIGFSKGGFYHHFDSKLELLEAICENAAETSAEKAKQAAEAEGTPMQRLSRMLEQAAFWHDRDENQVAMLIGVAYREDSALMRERMKVRQLQSLVPVFSDVMAEGCRTGEIYSENTDQSAEMILRLYQQLIDELSFLMREDQTREEILSRAVTKLRSYRQAMERILIAPIGSLEMTDTDSLKRLVFQVLAARNKNKEEAGNREANHG